MISPLNKAVFAAIIAASVVAGLASCSSDAEATLTATPITTPTSTETASPTPTPEPTPGSRGNPLPIGESRKIADDSMWSIGATGETYQHGEFLVVPVQIGLDWEQFAINNPDTTDIDSYGIVPGHSLTVEYVTPEGNSYRITTWSSLDELPEHMNDLGSVFPPLDVIQTFLVVNASDLPNGIDGVWRVANANGDSVFLASS